MLPPIIAEWPGHSAIPWQVRSVWNKYPALRPDAPSMHVPEGIYMQMPGYGYHEVLIDSPHHHRDLADLPTSALDTLLLAYQQRHLALCQDERNALVQIFRNRGPQAGASLVHPHSQILATGIIPRHIRWHEDEALRYFDERGRCIYCDIIAFEIADHRRVVLDSPGFLAFVPYAAEVPCEIWIVPKRHQADYGSMNASERAELANVLKSVLNALRTSYNDPDYNYMISTTTRHTQHQHLHWYLRICPQLVTRIGFEIGSGIRINPSLPETDAALLREAQLVLCC